MARVCNFFDTKLKDWNRSFCGPVNQTAMSFFSFLKATRDSATAGGKAFNKRSRDIFFSLRSVSPTHFLG